MASGYPPASCQQGLHQAVVVVLVEVFGQGGGHLCQVIHQADCGQRADDPGFDGSSTGGAELATIQGCRYVRVVALQTGLEVCGLGALFEFNLLNLIRWPSVAAVLGQKRL